MHPVKEHGKLSSKLVYNGMGTSFFSILWTFHGPCTMDIRNTGLNKTVPSYAPSRAETPCMDNGHSMGPVLSLLGIAPRNSLL